MPSGSRVAVFSEARIIGELILMPLRWHQIFLMESYEYPAAQCFSLAVDIFTVSNTHAYPMRPYASPTTQGLADVIS